MLSSFSNEQAKKWIKSNIKLIRTLNSCDLWKDYKYITAENKTLLINRYEPIAENIKDFLENFDPRLLRSLMINLSKRSIKLLKNGLNQKLI